MESRARVDVGWGVWACCGSVLVGIPTSTQLKNLPEREPGAS